MPHSLAPLQEAEPLRSGSSGETAPSSALVVYLVEC